MFPEYPSQLDDLPFNSELDVATVGDGVQSAVVYASCNSAANAQDPLAVRA
jgi:hypothetical protein